MSMDSHLVERNPETDVFEVARRRVLVSIYVGDVMLDIDCWPSLTIFQVFEEALTYWEDYGGELPEEARPLTLRHPWGQTIQRIIEGIKPTPNMTDEGAPTAAKFSGVQLFYDSDEPKPIDDVSMPVGCVPATRDFRRELRVTLSS